MSGYYDLGNHRRPVTTASPDAQVWFDRGLNWTYGFNHGEAIACFQRAIEHDPDCAMAYWGLAYAAGPNYNKHWELFDPVDLDFTLKRTTTAVGKAMELRDRVTPAERDLITALQYRYQSTEPPASFAPWNDAYADAMRGVYQRYPDDLDITALFAEAMMNRTPWKLWDLKRACSADGASTDEIVDVLERALEDPASKVHPGVLHMYIHTMEMSPFPERALKASDRLRGLVPDAGHLQHMPTHIDVLCGHYHNVVDWNHAAIVADRKFIEREGMMNVYTRVRSHNYHFKLYGAMFLGQYEAAMDAAREMVSTIPPELLLWEVPPMVDALESFLSMDLHIYIRFGKWQEIIDKPLPEDRDLYCVTTSLTHYAKGVAFAATGKIHEAEEQKTLFQESLSRIPKARRLHNNTCHDILAVAAEMLDGELEYRKGNFDAAFAHLRKSIELEDNLPYDEPWGWMQPTRHAFGALLLEQGHVEEAAAVYRADLGLDGTLARAYQHPENVWSLHGYHECLERMGRHDEARIIKQRLDLAMARADVPIKASCYCRMSHAA
jgi:tetratricopeptide (TPR) repeat protein